MFRKRTDLAVEAHEIYRQSAQLDEVPGVVVDTEKRKDMEVTRVNIQNSDGEKALGKPVGNYITLEIPVPPYHEHQTYQQAEEVLTEELTRLIELNDQDSVLVVGLGNWQITADALGPKVASSLLVTRHLFELMPEEIEDGVRPVSALSPGVLGLTGIETGEIIKGVVERIQPKLIIAIDALASRKLERVNSTIQLSDTGITPGSGVGNTRMGINRETLGVPVIAIGVPTVVDAATMANDAIDLVIDKLIKQAGSGEFYHILKELNRDEKYSLIHEVLNSENGNLVVTPKEVDEVIEDIAEIIANSINSALHKAISTKDANKYH